jgi:hypothetical protein
MRLKSGIYQEQQKQIKEELISILNLNEHNDIILYELDENSFLTNYNINDKGQIIALEFDEVTGTQNTNAKQEIKDNGTLFINGEFSEVD